MPTSLVLDIARQTDGRDVLTAAGEIDLSNIDAFRDALTRATTEATTGGGRITVDLRAVDYLDSAAINVLYAGAQHIQNLIVQSVLVSSLVISGLAELVTIEPAPDR
jgi:anti-anti-sigma factor